MILSNPAFKSDKQDHEKAQQEKQVEKARKATQSKKKRKDAPSGNETVENANLNSKVVFAHMKSKKSRPCYSHNCGKLIDVADFVISCGWTWCYDK